MIFCAKYHADPSFFASEAGDILSYDEAALHGMRHNGKQKAFPLSQLAVFPSNVHATHA